jgi:surface antigen
LLRRIALVGLLMLAACASTGPRGRVPGYSGGELSCVAYARARSGIDLRGDAWQWWEAAARSGRYERSRQPRVGSVLVFMRTSRNRSGHLAVVTRIISRREIRVDHANWATGRDRGRIARDQPVVDVSPGNDWSLVRVWYPPIQDFGRTNYPTYGFIHGGRLVAEAP